MTTRFMVAQWAAAHNFNYDNWRLVPTEKMNQIREGLSRFNTDSPIVSVVIPVWNEEKNLLRTLSSFSAMSLKYPTELIIVNNNSTDSTQELLDALGVKSILETRQGIAHARLAGLRASKGEYQLCGDGDSLYPPHWVETLVKPLMVNPQITCVYANYSFLPFGGTGRFQLGLYELMAELLFEFRRVKREFLNVRGANFGFRVKQGLAVKGFEMPVTRVFDNDESSKNFVVFGEDGRMGRKLGEFGKLLLVRSSDARMWTSSRRLLKDGNLLKAFIRRIQKESGRIFEYVFGPKKVKHTTDDLVVKSN